MPRCPAVQGPFWHLFLSALSTIAWWNWDIPQTCSRRVATGPYTNLAAALHRDGTVTRTKIRRVYAEGGRLHVPEGQVCMLQFFFDFGSQKRWFFLRKWLKSDTVSDFLHMLSISVSDLYRYVPQCFGFVSLWVLFRVTASHCENNVMAQLLPMKREGY